MRIKTVFLNTKEILNEALVRFEMTDLSVREVVEALKDMDECGELGEFLHDVEFDMVSNLMDEVESYEHEGVETEQDIWNYINNELNSEASIFIFEEDEEEAVIYFYTTLSALLNELNK